ncbi:MAG: hypothetical protein QXZ09_05545 [Candidatus Methanomethylicaceae archaeon]
MAAKVTAEDRRKYSATGDGRFPIKNKAQARSALRLRGHARNAQERRKIIRRAAKFLPEMARRAWESDRKAGKI